MEAFEGARVCSGKLYELLKCQYGAQAEACRRAGVAKNYYAESAHRGSIDVIPLLTALDVLGLKPRVFFGSIFPDGLDNSGQRSHEDGKGIRTTVDRLLARVGDKATGVTREIAQELRSSSWTESERARIRGVRATQFLTSGRLQAAQQEIDTALSWCGCDREAIVEVTGVKISLWVNRGRLDVARELVREGLILGLESANEEALSLAFFKSALVNALSGNLEEARSQYLQTIDLTRRPLYDAFAKVGAAKLSIELGLMDEARELLAVSDFPNKILQGFKAVTLAKIAAAQGELADAVEWQNKALDEFSHRRAGERAPVYVDLIRYLLMDGQSALATEVAKAARILMWDLEDERQVLAAAAVQELVEAGAEASLTLARVKKVSQQLTTILEGLDTPAVESFRSLKKK